MSLFATRKRTDFIVVHCTATPEGQEFHRADIDKMHRARGFSGIGYHFLIALDGTVEIGRPEFTVGAHVEGYNSISIGISYVGGVDAKGKAKDTRTPAQTDAIIKLIRELLVRYPTAKVVGHRDFSPDKNHNGRVDPYERIKECPCFDVIPWWDNVQKTVVVKITRYTVAKGDTLYSLARRFGTTVDRLAAASGTNPNEALAVGQVLTLPTI